MSKEEKSLSDSDSTGTSSSENEPETLEDAATEYEKQRQSRIAANNARMEALGLRAMAVSLMGSTSNPSGPKGNGKGKSPSKRVGVNKDEDDEYNPNDDDNDEDDEEEGSDGEFSTSDEEFDGKKGSSGKRKTPSGKVKGRKPKSMNDKKSADATALIDEDEALMQAIALSLKDCGPQGSNAQAATINEKEDTTRKRKRKPLTSRVQMTADDLIIHFFQFDEVGKGSITLRDLQRMATIHDFTWTDNELVDMIRCFDSDKDGKLTLDDFRNIAMRCNMFHEPENPCS